MMFIRKATVSDIPEMQALFRNTILFINRRDYSEEEVEDWISCGESMNRWFELLQQQHYIVSENEEGIITGFASVNDAGYLHSLYVHKDYQHQGIASLLYNYIEHYAREKGADRITSEVSITARPFFEKQGFQVDEEQRRKANELSLTNYKMSKKLTTF